jgi:DNA repair photolyase
MMATEVERQIALQETYLRLSRDMEHPGLSADALLEIKTQSLEIWRDLEILKETQKSAT